MKTARVTPQQIAGWLNIQQVNRVLEGMLEQSLQKETDLSWPEFELLFRLRVAGEHPLQMGEIAAQLINSPSGATRIADRLEEDGLISRATPTENRRVVEVRLTAKGRETLGRADGVFRGVLREHFVDPLSDAELDTLKRLLRKLLEKNGAWNEARCSPGAPLASS